jgi:hypothetical protein
MDELKVDRAPRLPGYLVLLLNGSHLAGTNRRLGCGG